MRKDSTGLIIFAVFASKDVAAVRQASLEDELTKVRYALSLAAHAERQSIIYWGKLMYRPLSLGD